MALFVADQKKYFRGILREARRALPKSYVSGISRAVQDSILRSPFYLDSPLVVLYAPDENEIETDAIFEDALHSGRRVLFPRIDGHCHQLSLIRVSDPAELTPGAFGLLEPAGAEIVPAPELGRALICVPGVAFSPGGQRLGRGGGYFDRLLAAAGSQVVTAGLAYSFQVVDRLPESPNDRRLDVIVTEFAMHVPRDPQRAALVQADQGGVPRCW